MVSLLRRAIAATFLYNYSPRENDLQELVSLTTDAIADRIIPFIDAALDRDERWMRALDEFDGDPQ